MSKRKAAPASVVVAVRVPRELAAELERYARDVELVTNVRPSRSATVVGLLRAALRRRESEET